MSNEIPATSEFAIQQRAENVSTTEMQISRQVAEVQASMVVSKNFPRDENKAFGRIIKACSRKSLAETAMYEYPRGGQKITGPSIRLAEAMAQAWGNLDFGIVELEQNRGESQVMAYAWDTETNTRQTKIFTVKHQRKAKGKINQLDDPRDIYEMCANQGARRLRACILGIIPGDVTEKAIEQCEKTLLSGEDEPLSDRIRKMIVVFEKEFQVTQEMIEERFQCKSTALSERDVLTMKKIYTSLKDGMSKREDYFTVAKTGAKAAAESKVQKDFELDSKGKSEKKEDKDK